MQVTPEMVQAVVEELGELRDFWGSVTVQFQAGRPVMVKVVETQVVRPKVEGQKEERA